MFAKSKKASSKSAGKPAGRAAKRGPASGSKGPKRASAAGSRDFKPAAPSRDSRSSASSGPRESRFKSASKPKASASRPKPAPRGKAAEWRSNKPTVSAGREGRERGGREAAAGRAAVDFGFLRKPAPRPARDLGIGPVDIAPPKDAPSGIGLLAAQAALDKKATDIVLFDVRGVSGLCDEMVVATATSVTHLGAVSDGIEEALRLKGERLLHSDGRRGAEPDWILLDYGDLMVHIFRAEARAHTRLEDYYSSARLVAKWSGE